MVSMCTDCDAWGNKKYIDKSTVDECKSRCLNEPTCVAIHFGKGSDHQGCYFSLEVRIFNGSIMFYENSGYDAWKKTTVCGNWLFFLTTLFWLSI